MLFQFEKRTSYLLRFNIFFDDVLTIIYRYLPLLFTLKRNFSCSIMAFKNWPKH